MARFWKYVPFGLNFIIFMQFLGWRPTPHTPSGKSWIPWMISCNEYRLIDLQYQKYPLLENRLQFTSSLVLLFMSVYLRYGFKVFTLVARTGTKLTSLLLSLVFYQEVWKECVCTTMSHIRVEKNKKNIHT